MGKTDCRKLISNSFDKVHEQISVIRSHVGTLEDPSAVELLTDMEMGLFSAMRKLRTRLDIPYEWYRNGAADPEGR